ncbi:MAG: phospholipid carrier-dependent glycosyltransferase, partial [Pseudoflavonifractor sp.]
MSTLAQYITPTLLLPLAVLAAIFCFFGYYYRALLPRRGTVDWVRQQSAAPPKRAFPSKLHPMERKDALPLLLLTAVYALTAFWNLGSLTNPQSFCHLTRGSTATFSFTEEVTLTGLMYYPGLNTGEYDIQVSPDGTLWYGLWAETGEDGSVASHYWADITGYAPGFALPQHYVDLYKWLEITPTDSIRAKYVRLTARPDGGKDWLELGELAFYDENGALISADQITAEGLAQPLFDEADSIPDAPSWFNSTYFDEIYHARTAEEHIRGISPYEISHPPLGKLILGLGIRMFGMTPFGWRFMGTLFGVLMLPLLYLFIKNLFGKTNLALCGTALFAFDFMHLTQTRIATIDTYGVFFILAMYYFM